MLNNQTGLKRLIFSYAAAGGATKLVYYTNIVRGTIVGSTGLDMDALNRARTVDYIPISKFVDLKIPSDAQYNYFVFLYKDDKSTFLRIPSDWSNNDVTGETIRADYPEYSFIRVIFKVGSGSSTVTDSDLDNFKALITVIS